MRSQGLPQPHIVAAMNQCGYRYLRAPLVPDLTDGKQLRASGTAMRGFTLVEAMVVMSIIAILMAVAVPTFRDFAASRAVTTHVSDFSGSLRLARTEAIKRGRAVVMCRTSDPQAASPVCDAGDNDWKSGWLIMQGDNLIRLQSAYQNSGGILSPDVDTITFRPTGIAPATSEAVFTFRPPLPPESPSYTSLTRRICVGVTGVTRTC